MKIKKPMTILTPSGCTLSSAKEGRCEPGFNCIHYSECLELSLKLPKEGFTSDCKGFQKKNIEESECWTSVDYHTEYKISP